MFNIHQKSLDTNEIWESGPTEIPDPNGIEVSREIPLGKPDSQILLGPPDFLMNLMNKGEDLIQITTNYHCSNQKKTNLIYFRKYLLWNSQKRNRIPKYLVGKSQKN